MDTATASSLRASHYGKPRRMLVVTHGYPPIQNHGAELHIQRKVGWWRSQGHDVRVVAADPRPASEIAVGSINETEDGVDGVNVLRVQFAVPDSRQPLSHTFKHPLLKSALEREIITYRPDVVYQVSGYIFGVLPLQLAQQHATPSVLFATDYWHVCQRITLLRPDQTCCTGPRTAADCAACRLTARNLPLKLGYHGTRRLWQVAAASGWVTHKLPLADPLGVTAFVERETAIADALREVSLVVANSQFLGSWMRRAGVPDDRILIIRQGINPSEFTGQARELRTRDQSSGLNVLYLGQVTRHKGVDTLVEAAGRLVAAGQDINLKIHGPVTDGMQFLDSVREFVDGPGVSLEPPLTRSEIAAALNATDVLVVPSRWYDNSPNVVLEAFSCGVPVIASNHGGMAEMVRNGVDGLLFEPGNAQSLEQTLRRLLDDHDLLPRLRAGVRRPHDVEVEMRAEEELIARMVTV